jgi:hypothetical protein
MRQPSPRGTPIDLRRYHLWEADFAGYRHNVSEDRIREWLGQFQRRHRDLAARVLDCVDFLTHQQMSAGFRQILDSMDGWSKNAGQRRGKWRFTAFSTSAGESGDSMLHKFRHANNLTGTKYNELFIHRSDLLREKLGVEDTVVLVDDFIGTGDQACNAWDNQFGELLTQVGQVYLVVIAANQSAIHRIRQNTGMQVVAHIELGGMDNVFSPDCTTFTPREKEQLLLYCRKASKTHPQGHGNCGLLVVFAHTCPNDSISVLHVSSAKWQALFRRYD